MSTDNGNGKSKDKDYNSPNLRDKIRTAVLGNTSAKFRRERITVWGIDIEVRQPSMRQILGATEITDRKTQLANQIINTCYVPGTDEAIFEPGDIDTILSLPFDENLHKISDTLNTLIGSQKEEEKNSDQTQPVVRLSS